MSLTTIYIRGARGEYATNVDADSIEAAVEQAVEFFRDPFWKGPKPKPGTVLRIVPMGGNERLITLPDGPPLKPLSAQDEAEAFSRKVAAAANASDAPEGWKLAKKRKYRQKRLCWSQTGFSPQMWRARAHPFGIQPVRSPGLQGWTIAAAFLSWRMA